MGIFTKKSDGESGGPNRHERRAAVARARHAPQWQKEWKQRDQLDRQKRQRHVYIDLRQQRTHERAVMRKKMAKVGGGIAQPHLEHRVPKFTKPKS